MVVGAERWELSPAAKKEWGINWGGGHRSGGRGRAIGVTTGPTGCLTVVALYALGCRRKTRQRPI